MSTCLPSTLLLLSHSLFRSGFSKSLGDYKKLGQFDYEQQNCTIDHVTTCIGKDNDWIYIGEVKEEGTDHIPHGIGIKVWSGGSIKEGYWKDGEQHGRGRYIYNGDYYIGEFKEGRWDGEGTYYYKNGDRYKGKWKDNLKYGKGTYYTKNGVKYVGQWDGWKGQGKISYTDGKKYIGEWDWKDGGLKRHGLGTQNSANGQVLNQGKWDWDRYKGKE